MSLLIDSERHVPCKERNDGYGHKFKLKGMEWSCDRCGMPRRQWDEEFNWRQMKSKMMHSAQVYPGSPMVSVGGSTRRANGEKLPQHHGDRFVGTGFGLDHWSFHVPKR